MLCYSEMDVDTPANSNINAEWLFTGWKLGTLQFFPSSDSWVVTWRLYHISVVHLTQERAMQPRASFCTHSYAT